MTTTAALTPDQQQRVDRACEVLTGLTSYEPLDMAARIGSLEWHLAELLALVGDMASR
jgi:hypothetical protein